MNQSCPDCIAEVDNSVPLNRQMNSSQPTSTKRPWWPLFIIYALIAFLALVEEPESFFVASAIFGQGHQSHETTRDLTVTEGLGHIECLSKDIRQSSTDLAERLKVIESLSKDVRVLLTESAHILAARKPGISASDHSNSGPSLSPNNHDSAPPASASDRKKKPESGFTVLDKLFKAVGLSLARGLATVSTMATLLAIALLLIKKQVTTRRFIDPQFSIGPADKLELSRPRGTDTNSSQIIEEDEILEEDEISEEDEFLEEDEISEEDKILLNLSLDREVAKFCEGLEPRRTDVPTSQKFSPFKYVEVSKTIASRSLLCFSRRILAALISSCFSRRILVKLFHPDLNNRTAFALDSSTVYEMLSYGSQKIL